MKRNILLFLVVLLPVVASAYYTEINGIYYNFSGNEAIVTYYNNNYNSYSGDVVIPESVTYNGTNYSVTSIGSSAFSNCTRLTSITLPNSLTTIGNYAFSYCSSLTSITLPDSLTTIGNSAFSNCSRLTSITIPEGVTSIGSYTFYNCTSLTSITIPEGVTSIDSYAFKGCSRLTSITIPEGVTSIGSETFYGCSSLTSITIPEGVTSIGSYAFNGCSGLFSFTIPKDVTTIGNNAFYECYFTSDTFINNSILTNNSNWGAILCEEETNEGLLIKGNSVVKCRYWATSVNIPNNVISIGERAFSGCRSLTSVFIPDNVTSIGNFVFDSCEALTTVNIPEGVTRIGRRAFHGCISLTSFTIPESVTMIASLAFDSCDGLTSITIPENVTTIESSAFSGCYFTRDSFINKSQLTDNSNWGAKICDEITSDGLKIIDNAIIKCRYASTFIAIPESVTKVEEFAFSGCSRLKKIVFNDGNSKLYLDTSYKQGYYTPKWFNDCPLDSIYVGRDLDCSFVATDNNLTYTHSPFKNMITLRSVEFGGHATEIPVECFSGCTNLTSVKLSDSIESIGVQAFYPCKSLSSINIGRSVKKIGREAFLFCHNLKKIVIPNNVEEIGAGAFDGLNLSSLIIEDGEKDIVMTDVMHVTSARIFSGNTIDSVYWGRTGAVMKYAKIKHLTIGKIKIFEGLGYNDLYGSIGCDTINVLNIKEASDTLYFSVNQRINIRYYYIMPFTSVHIDSIYCNRIIGIYNNYNVSDKQPFDGVESLIKLELGRKLTSVNDGMFYGCHVQSLYIPNTIKSIASTSFQFCSDLSSVQVEDGPDPLNFGEGNNFYGCPLRCVYIGRDMTYSTNSPFNRNKEGITSLTIGNNVTEIPDNAFSGMKNITELTLTSGLKKIGGMAFYGCEGLKSLSIPGSVTEVGQQAFNLCRNLKTLILEDNSEELTFTTGNNNMNNAFANSPLKEVYLGRDFNYSNNSPFFSIDSLLTLTLSNNVTYLKDGAFAGCSGLKEVYSYAEDAPNITSTTFGGIEVNRVLLMVPDEALDEYKSHPIWKQFWIESPTDIDIIPSFAKEKKLTDIYDINGLMQKQLQKGINIIRYSDGTTRKILIK